MIHIGILLHFCCRVNACPTPIDALLLPETKTQPIDVPPTRPPASPSFFGGLQVAPLAQKLEPLKVTIAPYVPSRISIIQAYNIPSYSCPLIHVISLFKCSVRFCIFHIYNIPPVIPGTSLGMKLRLSLVGRAEWSERVKCIFPPPKEETVSRLQMECSGFASVEVEILMDTNDFVGALPAIQRGQQACVISSPR